MSTFLLSALSSSLRNFLEAILILFYFFLKWCFLQNSHFGSSSRILLLGFNVAFIMIVITQQKTTKLLSSERLFSKALSQFLKLHKLFSPPKQTLNTINFIWQHFCSHSPRLKTNVSCPFSSKQTFLSLIKPTFYLS